MTEHISIEEIPTWTAGWTAGYAAGIKRALADCPTHGVCPNCREGWGHYTHEYGYLPTVQSEVRIHEDEDSPCPDCWSSNGWDDLGRCKTCGRDR